MHNPEPPYILSDGTCKNTILFDENEMPIGGIQKLTIEFDAQTYVNKVTVEKVIVKTNKSDKTVTINGDDVPLFEDETVELDEEGKPKIEILELQNVALGPWPEWFTKSVIEEGRFPLDVAEEVAKYRKARETAADV